MKVIDKPVVGVVGFGTMGGGIAQVCAAAGSEVIVLETDAGRIDTGRRRLEASLKGGIDRGKLNPDEGDAIGGRIRGTLDVRELGSATIVIESIVEELPAKQRVLAQVSDVVSENALIATNTSALAVGELAVAVRGPARFAGLHFFNPAPLMGLVEIVDAELTAPETVAAIETFAEQIGKEAIVTKDRPGFLVNRLLMPYLNQAVQAHDDGIATREDIDLAVRLGLGYPLGPLELLDVIGLDVHGRATTAAYEQLLDPHFAAPPELSRLIAAGRTGRKAARGFYYYEEG
jgi:3-hydroxybutyryl-CoA dehydrogenase